MYVSSLYDPVIHLQVCIDLANKQTYTAQHLLTPSVKSSDALAAPTFTGEQLMKSLLDQNITCAVRIGASSPYNCRRYILTGSPREEYRFRRKEASSDDRLVSDLAASPGWIYSSYSSPSKACSGRRNAQ